VAGGLEGGVAWIWPAAVKWPGREVAGAMPVDAAADVPVTHRRTRLSSTVSQTQQSTRDRLTDWESCGLIRNCPTSAPMCLNFRCAKCAGHTTTARAGKRWRGRGRGVRADQRKCVACVKSSECTADPTKPVCVANQCAACSAAASECETKE